MLFFLRGADRIDISLSGLTASRLRDLTSGHGAPAQGWREERIGSMAAWCINRVYWDGLLDKAYWHCQGSLSRQEALDALEGKVAAAGVLAWDRRGLQSTEGSSS